MGIPRSRPPCTPTSRRTGIIGTIVVVLLLMSLPFGGHSSVAGQESPPLQLRGDFTTGNTIAGFRLADRSTSSFAINAISDTVIANTPYWHNSDLVLGGIVVGTVALIKPLADFDLSVSRELGRHRDGRDSTVRTIGRTMGERDVILALSGSTYLLGLWQDNSKLKDIGLHSLEAIAISGLASEVLKKTVGRPRPSDSTRPDDLDPFQLSSGGFAFPSGHTTMAFSLATVLSHELKEDLPWVPYVAYPMAAWTGTTRLLDRKHWATDVLAGAALGILSGNLVERWNHRPDDSGLSGMSFTPMAGQGVLGLSMSLTTR